MRIGRQAGFTLLGLLFLVAVLGVGLAALGTHWKTVNQREKETELLFIGDQYRGALLSYYRLGPDAAKHYPKKLEDLLHDPRFPHTVRHLRRLWPDPVSGGDWALLRDAEGGIEGVHSPATAPPRKTAGFPLEYAAFEGAGRYADWVFLAEKPSPPTDAPASPANPAPSGAAGRPGSPAKPAQPAPR